MNNPLASIILWLTWISCNSSESGRSEQIYQDTTEFQNTTLNVDSLVRSIESNRTYDSVVIETYEMSSEGGEITGFFDSGQHLKKIRAIHFGEMGKIQNVHYMHYDSLIFQKRVHFTYDRPFYEAGYKVTVDSFMCNCITRPLDCDTSSFLIEKAFLLNKMNLKEGN